MSGMAKMSLIFGSLPVIGKGGGVQYVGNELRI
jgi:hypothetical protein